MATHFNLYLGHFQTNILYKINYIFMHNLHVDTQRSVAYPGIFFKGGVQQIQLRTEDRENGDLGAVAP